LVFFVMPMRNKSIVSKFKDYVLTNDAEGLRYFLSTNKYNYNKLLPAFMPEWTPFEHIAKKNEYEKLDILLKYGISPQLINLQDEETIYPAPALVKKPKMLQALLQYGLDVNSPNKVNNGKAITSLLYIAIENLFSGVFKYGKYEKLKEAGLCGSMSLQDWQAYYDKRNAEDPAILSSINFLLSSGANVDKGVCGDTHQLTPLMLACWKGRIDMIELLLHKGADPYINDNHFFALDFCYMTDGFVSEEERQKAINLLVERMQK